MRRACANSYGTSAIGGQTAQRSSPKLRTFNRHSYHVMSKRTRHADNSKRQQPMQQQRAQARQTGSANPSRTDNNKMDSNSPQQPRRGGEAESGGRR